MIYRYLMALTIFVAAMNVGRAAEPVLIGLDADMSLGSARAGEAIRRGALVAIEELNAQGGVLGRPLKLVVRDHRGNPARGKDNIVEFAGMKDLVAVLAGLHSPIAMAEMDAVHQNKVVFLVPWAAATKVIDNGRTPNYAFRLSVRDQFAGGFLVDQALALGHRKIALLLERTGWGESNDRAMRAALAKRDLNPTTSEWYLLGTGQMATHLDNIAATGADTILFVGNAPEGSALVHAMASRPEKQRLPILSHWGITGGNFHRMVKDVDERVDLRFLQTFSFLENANVSRVDAFVKRYQALFPDVSSARKIFAPVGTAHAYDLVKILAAAIEKAGAIDRSAVRDAMENLGPYDGLTRRFERPFTPDRHDALTADDFQLARYATDGAIEPEKTR